MYAHNSIPREATGESPYVTLHRRHLTFSQDFPDDTSVTAYLMHLNHCKQELVIGLQDSGTDINEDQDFTEKAKHYDRLTPLESAVSGSVSLFLFAYLRRGCETNTRRFIAALLDPIEFCLLSNSSAAVAPVKVRVGKKGHLN